jgi:hypothetical protein
MTRLSHLRPFIRSACLSLGMLGVASDVIINPHLYGDIVHWTSRSTMIACTTSAIWLAVITITSWAEHRAGRLRLPGSHDCA